jgi:hypothetical protein
MRIGYSPRGGPYFSMGCLGWFLVLVVVVAAGGWLAGSLR